MMPWQSPFEFRSGHRSRNRIVLAPMTNCQSDPETGALSNDEFHWLKMRADGGFGVIVTAAAFVDKRGKAWAGQIGVGDVHQDPGLRRLASLNTATGSLILPQLFHGGARASAELSGAAPLVPSARPNCEELTRKQITEVVEQFATAAAAVSRCGLAGAEIHGANGYLITQFLSPSLNTRSDEYGGTPEKRARFLREIIEATSAKLGPKGLLSVRISPLLKAEDGKIEFGWSDTVRLLKLLPLEKLDAIHLSTWDHTLLSGAEVASFELPSHMALWVAGGIRVSADAEKLLGWGATHAALGLAGISNPRWPKEAAAIGFSPHEFPRTEAQLREAGLGSAFINYLRRFPRGLVKDESTVTQAKS